MKPTFLTLALAALALLTIVPARADNSGNPYQGRANFTIDCAVQHIDTDHSRIMVAGNDGTRYTVDASDSDIILPSGNSTGRVGDLSEGQSIHVIGTLLEDNLIEADRVRVIPADTTTQVPFTDAHADYEHISLPQDNTPPAAAAQGPASSFEVNGLVRSVDPDNDHMTIVDANDNRFTVDTYGSDVILADIGRAGKCADLARGMHVRISGTQLPNGTVVADRVRVVSDSDLTAANVSPAIQPMVSAHVAPVVDVPVAQVIAAPVIAAPVVPMYSAPPVQAQQMNVPLNYTPADITSVDLDRCTGILIDCRDQPNILRSPSPAIYGPDMELLYPDRSHVPTPDEVQDESIVRYYRTMIDAENGVAGDHPLILRAACVIGPAQDGVQLTAQDMALFIALDKKLHYSRNWKVGFLIPPDK